MSILLEKPKPRYRVGNRAEMKFDPGMNDRELLELISIATRVPSVRLALVAKLEQLMELYKDEIREQIERELQPAVPLQAALFPLEPVSKGPVVVRPDDPPLPREYELRLVQKQGAWVQDNEPEPGALYLLMPEVIDYIVSELSMVKRIKDQRTVIASASGFRFLCISARRVSDREICGSLTDLNENPYPDEAGQGENRIGDNVVFGHGAISNGRKIGDNVMISIKATILHDVEIGDHSIIAAGCVVTEKMKIPPRSFVVGVPAKIKGKIAEEQLWWLENSHKIYEEWAEMYKKEGLDTR